MRRPRTPRCFVAVTLVVLSLASCRKESSEPSKAAVTPAAPEAAVTTVAPTEPPSSPTPPPTATPLQVAAQPTSPPAAPPEEPVAASETASGAETELELLGVIRAADQPPAALIEFRGSQELFRKGDSVFDQGVLREVKENAVVVRRGKEDLTLELPRTKAEVPPTPEPPLVELRKASEAEAAPPPVEKAIPRSEIRAALQAFGKVLADAEAERVAAGGGHGLRLKNVEAKSVLGKLGLKSGDVLQKLNGIPVDDLSHLPDLTGAADRAELTVTFVRNDIGLTFSRPIQ